MPGNYSIQVSGDSINVTEINNIILEPEFTVKKELSNTGLWKYTITQVFGEYKYKDVEYQYRLESTDGWTDITDNTFEAENQSYEIQAIDMQDRENPVIIKTFKTN